MANRTISKDLCCGVLKQGRNAAAKWRSRPSIHIIGTRIAHLRGHQCASTPCLYRMVRYAASPPRKSAKIVVYAFAHKLTDDASCVTMITLREDTFLAARETGFLNVRGSDIVFRLNAPELRQV